ncbi:cold shock domain-containing protein C2 [Alligator mississippiensis]|uniref:Cold shock domain-containing protein C2 n=1 Tax=Alligator mississippiensis TaxID=8496 RepID=A0A151NHE7_ALLMI|nr:cold shock domain-containing protein C2 [Alligator mississippiensis]
MLPTQLQELLAFPLKTSRGGSGQPSLERRGVLRTNPELGCPRKRTAALHQVESPVWPTFPFQREGSRIWERGNLLLRDLPSPLPTKRTRTYSATARASAGPVFKGVCKQFSRSQGHGFITPENGTEDIFVHVSDIEGEYVPMEGDEVTYKICPIPPKNQKFQAVEVVLTNLAPHTKHETWSGQIIGS